VLKRTFDILAAGFLLLALAPVMLLVALLVLARMGRPVLFRQERPGLGGRPFLLYKFRTMTNGDSLPDEERLTALGSALRRLSLDELPQLFNVLRGEMSLVGPRPLLMEYLPLYSARQARRHDVRPGITGWAQVNGRNATPWPERFEFDVWYVEHRGFVLDLKILWRTLARVVRRTGVSQPGQATMEKFRGNGG
jgi:lipopolysaccharide/colanic/teichoic acid biosynthesis glycosyltransferase